MFHWSFSISCHFSEKKVYILMWQYLTKNAILILSMGNYVLLDRRFPDGIRVRKADLAIERSSIRVRG